MGSNWITFMGEVGVNFKSSICFSIILCVISYVMPIREETAQMSWSVMLLYTTINMAVLLIDSSINQSCRISVMPYVHM